MTLPDGLDDLKEDFRKGGTVSVSIPDDADMPNDRGNGPRGDPPDAFDTWLDRRLRSLYRTVLNEPLPDEILDLLEKKRRSPE